MAIFVFALLSSQVLSAEQSASAIWNQWRGPSRDGKINGRAWSRSLSGLTQVWRVPLGPSYSGPIVAEDRVFTTETKDKKHEIVSVFDRKTGKRLWQARWEGAMKVPFFAASNGSWIRSTPAYDGDSLHVVGMRDVLVCLDPETGKKRWRVDFVKRFRAGLPPFGAVCSPLVDGDHVYMQAGGGVVKEDGQDRVAQF